MDTYGLAKFKVNSVRSWTNTCSNMYSVCISLLIKTVHTFVHTRSRDRLPSYSSLHVRWVSLRTGNLKEFNSRKWHARPLQGIYASRSRYGGIVLEQKIKTDRKVDGRISHTDTIVDWMKKCANNVAAAASGGAYQSFSMVSWNIFRDTNYCIWPCICMYIRTV